MPRQQVGDLATPWLESGQSELATEGGPAPTGSRVPALRRDPGRFETRRTTPDDQHPPRRAAGSNLSPPHSHSRPADGLTRQEMK